MLKPTQVDEYAEELIKVVERKWKHRLRFVDPHRQNVRALCRGRSVLELGCGAGRNLLYLGRSNCFGTDHNEEAVRYCRSRGLKVATSVAELGLPKETKFGAILLSRLIEHLSFEEAVDTVSSHVPLLESNGIVVIMTPQIKGQQYDETHVTFFDESKLDELAQQTNLRRKRLYSFPLPKFFGRFLYFNETVFIGTKNA